MSVDSQYGTLVAATVDTVTLEADWGTVEVINLGTLPIYFRVDGTNPVVEGDGCHVAPPNGTLRVAVDTDGPTEVKLISTGTPKFGVVGDPKGSRSGAGIANVAVDMGDVALGAVELKDGATDTRAKVGVPAALVAGDNAVAVHDVRLLAQLLASVLNVDVTDDAARVLGHVTVDNAALEVTNDAGNPVPISAANLDIALSALRDAIVKSGATSKTLADLAALLNGGLPAALAAGGGLKVEGVAGGVTQPVDTELAAAVLLAAAMGLPTTAPVIAHLAGYNGATADPIRSMSLGGTIASGTPGVLAVAGLLNDSSTLQQPISARNTVDNTSAGAVAPHVMMATNNNVSNFDVLRSANVFKPISTVAVGAETTIWTPTSGKKFRVMGFLLALSAATTLTLKDGTGGTTILRMLLGAGGPGIFAKLGNGVRSTAANNVLTATSGAAANLDGFVFGTEE